MNGEAFGIITDEQRDRNRRAVAPVKGRPRTVSREVPVTILRDGDGTMSVINHETAEPCYGCACCVVWASNLDQLAGAIRTHEDERHGAGVPVEDPAADRSACLVCAMLAGAIDG
jgi:hypothetical protein